MVDYFALLNEPRRPWLDVDALKATFHSLSATVHPDRFHSAPDVEKQAAHTRYTELNAAYQCLREPKDRLLHLLTLERGAKPADIQIIPPAAVDLFGEIGQLCRDVDAFLAEKAKVTSPLLKVQQFEKGMAWSDKLTALQLKVNARRDHLFQVLQSVNAAWTAAPAPGDPARASALPLEQLEHLYRALSFVTKWNAQLQERIVQLAF